jgi:hypothetical protein
VVVAVEVLSLGVSSAGVTVAVLEMVPLAVAETVTLIVKFASPPAARLPAEQVTVAPAAVHPVEAVAKVTCDGSVSLACTFVAVAPPELWTAIVYASGCPGLTVAGAVFTIDSAGFGLGFTVVEVDLVLFAEVGSGVEVAPLEMETVFDRVPGVVAVRTIVTVAFAAFAIVAPRLQVMVVEVWVHVPVEGVADTNADPDGSVSVNVTFVDVSVPAFVTLAT